MLQSRYLNGTKVRITAQNSQSNLVNPEILHYNNQIGEIVHSVAALGFVIPQSWTNTAEFSRHTLYYYEVQLEDGTILQYVSEDCLETFEESVPIASQ